MGAVKLSENIYWVGAVDADVREFHGYKVPYGTTYNAYLVIDEKIALIDSVKAPFTDVMMEHIREVIDPSRIDYIISNHVEPDHSGALSAVVAAAPHAPVFTTANGKKGLSIYYDPAWNYHVVKTGDTLSLGKYTLTFVATPMVHWPDNMVTFLKEEGILFSNDAFGQHQATESRFADEVGDEWCLARAKDYYANIVLPYGMQVNKALKDLSGLDIRMIAPSHGVIWHKPEIISALLAKYDDWANNRVREDYAVIVYDTMWGSTEMLAHRIADDFRAKGITSDLVDLRQEHISQAMDRLMEAKYICVGSPTLNRSVMPSVAAFLCYLKGLAPKGRVGMAFGSHGWSGEATGYIEDMLKACKYELLPKMVCVYRPDK